MGLGPNLPSTPPNTHLRSKDVGIQNQQSRSQAGLLTVPWDFRREILHPCLKTFPDPKSQGRPSASASAECPGEPVAALAERG